MSRIWIGFRPRNWCAAARWSSPAHRHFADGVAAGEFRAVHAAFVADAVAATMQQIQSGAVLAVTGLSDAEAYDRLAALALDGIRS